MFRSTVNDDQEVNWSMIKPGNGCYRSIETVGVLTCSDLSCYFFKIISFGKSLRSFLTVSQVDPS